MRTWAFAIALLLFISAGAAYAVVPSQSTLPTSQPNHYACTVTGQSGIVISNCFGQLIGPEPDGSFYVGAGLSLFGPCNAQNWNPSGTFAWTGGNVTTGFTSGEHWRTLPSQTQLYAAWTATNPDGSSAKGTLTIYLTAGTNSFTNSYGTAPPTCTTTSTTSSTSSTMTTAPFTTFTTSSMSTSTSQSQTIINNPPSQTGLNAVTSGILVIVALIFLGVGFTGKGKLAWH